MVWIKSAVVSTLAVAVGVLVSCGESTINMVVDQGGKLFLKANKGDVVTWGGATVTFSGNSPCKETKPIKQCTIAWASNTPARFFYTCDNDGCPDPVIVVGDYGDLMSKKSIASSRTPASYVVVKCDANQKAALEPDPAPVQASGQALEWIGSSPVDSFTVTFPTYCTNSPINSDKGEAVCRPEHLTAGMSYPYSVNASACSVLPTVSGTIAAK